MIRRCGAFLLALPLVAVLAVPAALAQSYQPYYRSAPQGPPPGYQLDPNNPDVAIRRPPQPVQQRVGPYPEETEAVPPPAPGFSNPQFGHQLDAQQPPGNVDRNIVRPPAPVGPMPGAAIPQQQQQQPGSQANIMALPPEDQPETGKPKELPDNLKRQLVDFRTKEPAGTIIIDTPHTYLYLILGNGRAIRYGIGVGREGFTWSGTERISKMKEWPDWFPPAEMIERQPYLPRMMAGGDGNPLGARALYLGHTLYRIHGTNQPSTIGTTVSSGCIRLLNQDIEDLYSRVQVGSRVVVLPGQSPDQANAAPGPGGQPGQSPAVSAQPLPPIR